VASVGLGGHAFGERSVRASQCDLDGLVQGGLVGLDDEQVMGLLVRDQPVRERPLGVQGVRGHHDPGQVQIAQQWLHGGDLVGLVVDLPLGQHDPLAVGDRGHQVRGTAVDVGVIAGAAHGLAVH
jgi:hypothetical protein